MSQLHHLVESIFQIAAFEIARVEQKAEKTQEGVLGSQNQVFKPHEVGGDLGLVPHDNFMILLHHLGLLTDEPVPILRVLLMETVVSLVRVRQGEASSCIRGEDIQRISHNVDALVGHEGLHSFEEHRMHAFSDPSVSILVALPREASNLEDCASVQAPG